MAKEMINAGVAEKVDSVDSMGWKLKSSYGAFILPEVGERHISKKDGKDDVKLLEEGEEDLLVRCKCPICAGRTLDERKNALDNYRSDTFINRAIHNAYILKQEEKLFQYALIKNDVLEFVRSRLKKLARYYKAFSLFAFETEKLFD